jgi:hypothetical protein
MRSARQGTEELVMISFPKCRLQSAAISLALGTVRFKASPAMGRTGGPSAGRPFRAAGSELQTEGGARAGGKYIALSDVRR